MHTPEAGAQRTGKEGVEARNARLFLTALGLVEGGGTRDNLDELVGDGGLAGAVVEERQLLKHLGRVIRGGLHGRNTRGVLARSVLGDGVEESLWFQTRELR